MGTIVAAEDVEKEGTSGDGDTNAGGESGAGEFSAGESGRVGECREHGKTVLECVKHRVQCIMATNRARCENCQVKHYGCSLVPLKKSGGGRGGASGSQKAKAVEESQTKGWARKAQKVITLGKSIPIKCRCC